MFGEGRVGGLGILDDGEFFGWGSGKPGVHGQECFGFLHDDLAQFVSSGQTIKAAKAGKYKGGSNAVFNLKNKGVALGKISPKLKGKLRTQILAKIVVLQKQIIAGKIKVPTTVS